MDPNSDTQDIVDNTATENTGEQRQEPEDQPEGGEGQPTPAEGEGNGKNPDLPKEDPKPKNRAQERIQQLAREKADLAAKVAEYEAKQNAPTQTQDEPKLEDFEDYNEWQKDLRRYDREQIKKEMLAEMGQKETQKSQNQRQAEFEAAMVELQDEGVDAQALTQKLETLPPLPIDLHQFGLSAKETLTLAAKLINDDELWLDISQMNPVQAARRIGQEIDKQPSKSAAPKIPNAPKPIKPTSGNAPVKRDPKTMSDDEWYRAETQSRKGK